MSAGDPAAEGRPPSSRDPPGPEPPPPPPDPEPVTPRPGPPTFQGRRGAARLYGAPRAEIPSLGHRIAVGTVMFIALLVLIVVVPYEFVNESLLLHGSFGLSIPSIVGIGLAIAVLSPVAYVAKPTRWYGPLFALKCLVVLLYLWVLASIAVITVTPSWNILGVLLFGTVIVLAMSIPGLKLVSALLTTIEDLVRPGERLPWDFPPRSRR